MTDGDAQLMLRFKRGDREAFEELFRRYTSPVVSFLTRLLRDPGRAEELAQEVFVRIYQARDRYEPRARFSTWLFGIAHNLALNELGRAYRKRERPLEEGFTERLEHPGPGAEDQVDARRTALAVERALERLPDRQRAALLLRTQEGLAYAEIAEVLGTSQGGVKSLLHRARESCLETMRKEGK